MKTSQCSGCRAEIIWTTTRNGKKMPVDAEPDPEGIIVLEFDGDEPFAIYDNRRLIEGERYTSHFATCPKRGEFRR